MVITSGIQIPNGLALDESDNKLYWAGTDANEYGIIEAVALDGLNRTVIFYRSGYLPFGLDTFQDIVYWSDWEKGAVLRINKTDGGGEEVLVSGLNQPMGLKILHRHKEKKGKKIRIRKQFPILVNVFSFFSFVFNFKQRTKVWVSFSKIGIKKEKRKG